MGNVGGVHPDAVTVGSAILRVRILDDAVEVPRVGAVVAAPVVIGVLVLWELTSVGVHEIHPDSAALIIFLR